MLPLQCAADNRFGLILHMQDGRDTSSEIVVLLACPPRFGSYEKHDKL